MEAASYGETSVTIYTFTLRYIPKNAHIYSHPRENSPWKHLVSKQKIFFYRAITSKYILDTLVNICHITCLQSD
jgi:hypothetical protein